MSKSLIFTRFVTAVIKDNQEDEFFWLIGTVLRAIHAYILNPLILTSLLDDAIGRADVVHGLNLAILKVLLLFMDQYTYFHYNSNVGIGVHAPIRWILTKWQSLPLDMQLDHERLAAFRTLFRRADEQFSSRGFSTLATSISLIVNVACALIATGILSGSQVMYLYPAYAFALIIIFFVVNRTVPRTFADINDAFWELQSLFEEHASLLFTEMIAVSSFSQGPRLMEQIIELHRKRVDRAFDMYYIDATQKMYTGWIMMVLPIFVYGGASVFVEFGLLSAGSVVSILASFDGARSNLIQLCSMKEEWRVAVDLVGDLSALLCTSKEGAHDRVRHTQRAVDLIKEQTPDKLGLQTSLSVHAVDWVSPDESLRDTLGTAPGLQNINGNIPLGGLYGFTQQSGTLEQRWRSSRIDHLFGLFDGLRTPKAGVVLVPPHVAEITTIARDPGLIERGTVLENVVWGMPLPTAEYEKDERFLKLVCALALKLGMHAGLFSSPKKLKLPMMQVPPPLLCPPPPPAISPPPLC